MDGSVNELERLKAMLKARTDRDGKPKYGFKRNTEEIRARIAELEGKSNGNEG